MSQFWKVVAIAAVVVLALDTVASFASAGFDFPYAYSSAGSFVIYAAVGYLAFRRWGFQRALSAAVAVAAVDATLGLYISYLIVPEAFPKPQDPLPVIATSIVAVLIFAVISASIGATLARLVHGRRPQL